MQKYFSACSEMNLLHVIADINQSTYQRSDLCPPSELVQVAIIPLTDGKYLKPHKHSVKMHSDLIKQATQECWLVYRGSLYVRLYDESDALIHEQLLQSGQILITFKGGHAFECMEPNTILIEFKNGPYSGAKGIPIGLTDC